MGHGPWAMGHGPWAMGHGPWAMGLGPWAMGHGPWVLIHEKTRFSGTFFSRWPPVLPVLFSSGTIFGFPVTLSDGSKKKTKNELWPKKTQL